jgi:enamine deaminase RidA (YjgF/YER057c/UK114 family)
MTSKWLSLLLPIAALTGLAGCASRHGPETAHELQINRVNPDSMIDPTNFGYSQIVTVENARLVFLAGQGPTMLDGPKAGPDDLRGQTRNAVDNILLALEAIGAGPEHIVNLRINVVDYHPRMLIDIAPELKRLQGPGGKPPASVFIGVSSLVLPTTKIEIETVAAVPLRSGSE